MHRSSARVRPEGLRPQCTGWRIGGVPARRPGQVELAPQALLDVPSGPCPVTLLRRSRGPCPVTLLGVMEWWQHGHDNGVWGGAN